jgi:K+-transporting ATPase ATPase B chain
VLAKQKFGCASRELPSQLGANFVPFTAQTRMSGVDLDGGRSVRKGAATRSAHVGAAAFPPAELTASSRGVARAGGTPLVVADGNACSASST